SPPRAARDSEGSGLFGRSRKGESGDRTGFRRRNRAEYSGPVQDRSQSCGEAQGDSEIGRRRVQSSRFKVQGGQDHISLELGTLNCHAVALRWMRPVTESPLPMAAPSFSRATHSAGVMMALEWRRKSPF